MKTYIIGAGGTGSWLAASLVRLVGPDNVVLVDGDKLEARNLDRQLFQREHIGQNKAQALAGLYGCDFLPEWYSSGLTEHGGSDVLFVAVDNHPGRASALLACDFAGCSAIFGANETHSAEAYVYLPEWRGTRLDPREYYPDILTVTTGDPRAGLIGCTGEAQLNNRQLVSANFMAAALMQHLFVAHFLEGPKASGEARASLPHRLRSNLTRLETMRPTNEDLSTAPAV